MEESFDFCHTTPEREDLLIPKMFHSFSKDACVVPTQNGGKSFQSWKAQFHGYQNAPIFSEENELQLSVSITIWDRIIAAEEE